MIPYILLDTKPDLVALDLLTKRVGLFGQGNSLSVYFCFAFIRGEQFLFHRSLLRKRTLKAMTRWKFDRSILHPWVPVIYSCVAQEFWAAVFLSLHPSSSSSCPVPMNLIVVRWRSQKIYVSIVWPSQFECTGSSWFTQRHIYTRFDSGYLETIVWLLLRSRHLFTLHSSCVRCWRELYLATRTLFWSLGGEGWIQYDRVASYLLMSQEKEGA